MQTSRWPSGHTELTNGPIRVQVETIEHLFSAIDPMPMRQRELEAEIEGLGGHVGGGAAT